MTKLNELRKLIVENKSNIINIRELASFGYKKIWLKYAIKTLIKEKTLFRLKNGVYSKLNLDSIDPFKAATMLYSGYIGLSTASYLYGWIDEYQYTIFILTEGTSKKIQLGKHEIRAIAIGKRFVGSCYFKNYTVSKKAKTIFDLLYLMNIFGKESVIKYISDVKLSKSEWDEFISYCLEFGSKSFRQKAGYLLEKSGKKFNNMDKLMPKKPVVVRFGKGKLNTKWMVTEYD